MKAVASRSVSDTALLRKRLSQTASAARSYFHSSLLVQRKASCACGGGCPNCLNEEMVQRKAVTGEPAAPSASLGTNSSGSQLSESTRAYFEPLLGHDFSAVRVHTDTNAARSVDAHAFTIGHHITFDAGRYSPDSNEGRHLLAHELVHVVQQQHATPSLATAAVSSPDDPAEREADSAADALMRGEAVSPRAAPAAGVHRKMDNKVILKPLRADAKACVVHLHGEEHTALAVGEELYGSRCVNFVHLDTDQGPLTGDEQRRVRFDVDVKKVNYTCTADPNRVFSDKGRKDDAIHRDEPRKVKRKNAAGKEETVEKLVRVVTCKPTSDTAKTKDIKDADIEAAAAAELKTWVDTEWAAGISKCRKGSGTADLAGPLPVLALHNNEAEDKISRSILMKYKDQFDPKDTRVAPSDNPSFKAEPKTPSDVFFVTEKADFTAIEGTFNVGIQSRPVPTAGDDGSLSVALQNERFINVEKKGRKHTLKTLNPGFKGHDSIYVKNYAMAAKALEVFGVPLGPCGATQATTPTITPPVIKPPPATGTRTGSGSGSGSGSASAPSTTPSTGPYDYQPATKADKPDQKCEFFDPTTIVNRRNVWITKLSTLPVSDVLNWILGAWTFEGRRKAKDVPKVVQEGVDEAKLQRSCLLAAMLKGVQAQKGSLPVPVKKAEQLVESGQRSFAEQQTIWQEKMNFTRAGGFDKISAFAAGQSKGLLTAGGKWITSDPIHQMMWGVRTASASSKDPDEKNFIKAKAIPLTSEEREKEILQASSAPGVSRHHAGTDFDIGDTKKSDQLLSSLWQPGGPYADLGRWLHHNAATWGFMRPFEMKGGYGKGYMAEEWHWSYWPIAQALLDFARQYEAEMEKALHAQWGGASASPQFKFIWSSWNDFLTNVDETPRF